MWMVMAK